jgi:acyl-CoA thioesterase-1
MRITLATIATALLVASMGSAHQASAFARKPIQILPLGDSLTAGAYVVDGVFKTDAGYRYTLWKVLTSAGYPVHFVGSYQDGPANFPERHHEGHSGRRIDEIAAGAPKWVSDAHPDVVLLLIGTNDAIQNYDFPNVIHRLENLVSEVEAAAPHAQVFISTTIPNSVPEIETRVEEYNQQLTQWTELKMKLDPNIHFVDMYTQAGLHAGGNGAPSDLIDGVHPTPDGYAAMGRVWFQALEQVMQPR